MKVLFIDNIDSFTYNVVHLLAAAGAQPDVLENDRPDLTPERLAEYGALIVGPGPGTPAMYPAMLAVLRAAIDASMPVFGVCLGLQAIGEVCGARVVHAPSLMHGKVSEIAHEAGGIFVGLPTSLTATRYHSLCLDPASIPSTLAVTATSSDGVVQAIAHRERPVYAVQFHPESILSEHGEALVGNFLRLAAAR